MNDSVKISVVLPTYNVEPYMSRCLDSLQVQSFKDFEVVVVDDCGSDGSIEIASKYAEKDTRIKIVKNYKNLGTYHARRIGVEKSEGSFIVFLDPDDELEPNCLDLIWKKYSEHKSDMIFYGVVYRPSRKWYEKEMVVFPQPAEGSLILSYFKDLNKNYALGTLGKAFSKRLLLNVYNKLEVEEGFRFVFSEDTCLLLAAILSNPKYSVLKYNGYVYHMNPTSITAQDPRLMKGNMIQYDFMLATFQKLSDQSELSIKERNLIDGLLRKFQSEKHLFLRNSGGGKEYIYNIYKSFLLLPALSKLVRAGVFLISFSKIRL